MPPQIPELKADIRLPDYCCLGERDEEEVTVNAWFGPAGTVSPLHHDPQHNFLAQVSVFVNVYASVSWLLTHLGPSPPPPQVVGSKYIRLYSPEETDKLYPHRSQLLHNTSQVSPTVRGDSLETRVCVSLTPLPLHLYLQVEVENPDLGRFPDFAKAPYLECVLRPGDVLFLPARHWHYVRSLELSFSVSFWWS